MTWATSVPILVFLGKMSPPIRGGGIITIITRQTFIKRTLSANLYEAPTIAIGGQRMIRINYVRSFDIAFERIKRMEKISCREILCSVQLEPNEDLLPNSVENCGSAT